MLTRVRPSWAARSAAALAELLIARPVLVRHDPSCRADRGRCAVVLADRREHAGDDLKPGIAQHLLGPLPGARVIPVRGQAQLDFREPQPVDLLGQVLGTSRLQGPTTYADLIRCLGFHPSWLLFLCLIARDELGWAPLVSAGSASAETSL